MDDLLVKYSEELQKELGNKWSMYALDEEKVIIVLNDKTLICEYENEYEQVKAYVMVIDLKNVTYSYTPKFTSQSSRTKSILAKLAGEFMFDYNNQARLKLGRYVFNNIKKINENLISFDVFYNEDTILKNIEWNGSSLKSLKNMLLNEMIKNIGKDNEKYNKNILELCKVLSDNKYYCKLKGLAKRVLSDNE